VGKYFVQQNNFFSISAGVV